MIDIPEPIKRYDRFYYLVEYLSNLKFGVTVEEIAKAVGKSEKTVRRDLEAIEGILGIELVKERGEDKKYRYRIEKQATKLRPLLLSTYEVLALYFVRGFSHFKDVPLVQKNLAEVFRKISVSTKESESRAGNDFFKRVSNLFILPRELGGRVYYEKSGMDFLEKLIDAALDYKVCEITYEVWETVKKCTIGILHFFNYRDTMYLLCKNIKLSKLHKEDKYINLALHRVKEVIVLDGEYFEYPSDFDAKKFFDSDIFCFEEDKQKIKLKFPSHTSEYVLEREWYPNQKVELLDDGSVVISLESDLNMILIGWIRGFGADVEVLEPVELREMIIKDLDQNLRQYTIG